jgi:hypothetical protein
MTRQIYGASGAAQVVSPTGVPTTAPATVKSARTGGTTVTDVLNLAGGALAGVVTPDARGQIAFQGPDGSTSTYWLDFGDGGARWAITPADNATAVTLLRASLMAAEYTTPGGTTSRASIPYTPNTISHKSALVLDPLLIPRAASISARNTLFPSPVNGDQVFRTDLCSRQTYYTGLNRWVTDNQLLVEARGGSDFPSIFFSSIPQEWRHLTIRYHCRIVGSATDLYTSFFSLRFNNDSGTNYGYAGAIVNTRWTSGTPTFSTARTGSGGNVTASTSASLGNSDTGIDNFNGTVKNAAAAGICPGPSVTAGVFGSGEISIPDYTDTAFRKAFVGQGAYGDGATSGSAGFYNGGGSWANASAITRIDILPTSGTNFAAGSFFSLHGIA